LKLSIGKKFSAAHNSTTSIHSTRSSSISSSSSDSTAQPNTHSTAQHSNTTHTMSQGHRLYDHAALRKNKIEKLRLDNLTSAGPRLSGTGSARDLSRDTISNDWLVGGKSGGSWTRRSLTPRAMPWEKQPAVEGECKHPPPCGL